MKTTAVCRECGARWETETQPRKCIAEGCEAGWLDIPCFADPVDADRFERTRESRQVAGPRVSLNAIQTQALVSLLCTIGQHVNSDVRESVRGILVTVWRNGDPTTWAIAADGTTKEQA